MIRKKLGKKTHIYTSGGRMAPFLITALLAITLTVSSFAPAAYAAAEEKSLDEQINLLKLLIQATDGLYYKDVDIQDLIDGAYKGVFDRLDPYSVYYTDKEYEEFEVDVVGTFGGVGLQIAVRDGFVTVIAPLEDTPAYRAGMKTGDRVVSIDDTDVRDISIDKVASMMRGEPGTKVRIGVLREGHTSAIEFDLTRAIIEVNPVTYEVLEGDIGYIKLIEFNEHAAEHVDEALQHFDGLGIMKIILDLRNNPGGMIDQSVEVAGMFVPEGPIVHIERRNLPRQTMKSGVKEQKYDLAVLINGGSASASEIVAGAVQDTGAGTLIGTKTFGKGTVQQIFGFADSGRVKLTIAKYLTPEGRAIDGEGITPDMTVEQADLKGKYGEDLAPVSGKRKPLRNDVGLDVLGMEQRLDTMGYNAGEIDGVFDAALEQAVKEFQSDMGLYPYGVLDIVTQQRVLTEYELYLEENTPDVQLQKAVEVLKSEN